jgi:hypothetical protein
MGVAWFPCDACGESVCDCGPYTRCGCGRRWCDYKCAAEDEHRSNDDDEGTCKFCRGEDVENAELFAFLMGYHGVSRVDVLQEYLKQKGVKR